MTGLETKPPFFSELPKLYTFALTLPMLTASKLKKKSVYPLKQYERKQTHDIINCSSHII